MIPSRAITIYKAKRNLSNDMLSVLNIRIVFFIALRHCFFYWVENFSLLFHRIKWISFDKLNSTRINEFWKFYSEIKSKNDLKINKLWLFELSKLKIAFFKIYTYQLLLAQISTIKKSNIDYIYYQKVKYFKMFW